MTDIVTDQRSAAISRRWRRRPGRRLRPDPQPGDACREHQQRVARGGHGAGAPGLRGALVVSGMAHTARPDRLLWVRSGVTTPRPRRARDRDGAANPVQPRGSDHVRRTRRRGHDLASVTLGVLGPPTEWPPGLWPPRAAAPPGHRRLRRPRRLWGHGSRQDRGLDRLFAGAAHPRGRCGPAPSTGWRCCTSSAARDRDRIRRLAEGGQGDERGAAIQLTVNGRARRSRSARHHTLLDALRDDLGSTGTKECCLVGECGACTVLIDDGSVDACLVLGPRPTAGRADRRGARRGRRLHPLQAAFLDTGAAQCGFCIPGQLLAGAGTAGRVRVHAVPRSRRGSPATSAAAPATSRSSRPCCWRPVAMARGRTPFLHRDLRGRSRCRRPSRAGWRRNERAGTRGAASAPVSSASRALRRSARVTGRQAYVADSGRRRPSREARHDRRGARPDRPVDPAAALEVPGVRLVITAADLPVTGPRFGPQFQDRPVLAVGDDQPSTAIPSRRSPPRRGTPPRRPPLSSGSTYEALPAVHIAGGSPAEVAARPGPGLRVGDPLAGPTGSASTITAGATWTRPRPTPRSSSRAPTPFRWSPSS